MALFKRPILKEKGLNDEQIEWLMTESNRALAANYIPKAEVKEQVDAAVEAAKKDFPAQVKVEDSEEYKAVVEERDMLRALGGEEFSRVKPKFREAVYKMLDRGEDAPKIADQLKAIAEKYEEYFAVAAEPEQPKTPQFGAQVTGAMPTGNSKPTLESIWFGDKK